MDYKLLVSINQEKLYAKDDETEKYREKSLVYGLFVRR